MRIKIDIDAEAGIVTVICPFCYAKTDYKKIPEFIWCFECDKKITIFAYTERDTA